MICLKNVVFFFLIVICCLIRIECKEIDFLILGFLGVGIVVFLFFFKVRSL